MTDFEKRLRSALRREAAELVPEGTLPPGFPATGHQGWIVRWRLPLLAAATVLVVAATVMIIAIQNRGGSTVAGPATVGTHDAVGAPPQFTFPTTSRAKEYRTLDELAGDSTNVVLATPTGDSHQQALPDWAVNPNKPDPAPITYVTMHVGSVVAGDDLTAGDLIDVASFGTDADARAALTVPGSYLLFLAPSTLDTKPGEPVFGVEHYSVVGGAAGLYFHDPASTSRAYVKTDLDSPRLPDEVGVDTLDLMTGWYDAIYLDHVAAGQDPASLPPLQHPAGSAESPFVGEPAEAFLCDGTDTVAAAQRDDDWVSFGVTDSTFCVAIDVPDSDDQVVGQTSLTNDGPIRAMVRFGSGWEARVAGVVDDSVTTVLAIRGDDDSAHPDDLIPDNEVPLTQLGNLRAFMLDDVTRAVVAYSDGIEVARQSLPVTHMDDSDGGHGTDLQLYDLRDDLQQLRSQAWSAWTQIAPDTLRVFFVAGNSGCYGAVVTVEEDAHQVRIGVQVGWKPEVSGCDDMAVGAAADITLDAPLGDRAVIPLG